MRTNRGEFYNLEDENGKLYRVLVLRSIQYDPYTRHLTVTPAGMKRLANAGTLYAARPTPYRPRVILHTATA